MAGLFCFCVLDALNRRQLRKREPWKPKYETVEEAVQAQRLIRERHLIQKQQKQREEEERRAEQERRRQEAVRERLANANKKKRPTVPGLHTGEDDEEEDDNEEEDGVEEEEDDEEEEEVNNEEVDGAEVELVDGEEVEEEEGEHEEEVDNADEEEENEEEQSEAGDENEDAESEEAEGSEEGDASEDGDGAEGDDEAEEEEEEEVEEDDEEEDEDNSDDSDDDSTGSTTLYTFNDNPVRWKQKRKSTYHKRLAGKMRPPKLKRLGASFVKMENLIQESVQTPDTEIPTMTLEETLRNIHEELPNTKIEERPCTSQGERPSTSQEEKPSTSREEEPFISPEEQRSRSYEEKPRTSQADKPNMSREERPSTSREERPSTSQEDKPSTSFADRPEAESELGMERINVDEPFKPTAVSNSDPTIPFWKRFSYAKDNEAETRLKTKADTHPEPVAIKNARSNSDNSGSEGDHKVKELESREQIANMTNEEFEKHLALQGQEILPQLKRRLFGQTYSAHDYAPMQEETAWHLEEAIHQSLLDYQRYIYMQEQQKPSTSKAADEADIGLLRLAQMAVERNKKPENQQEHIETVAQQEGQETRDLVSPNEYLIDINMYTDMLLNTVARKCEDMQLHGNNWTRYGNIDPHMQKFLDCLPTRPPAAHQSASSAPINIHSVVPSLSSVAIDDNNAPTPDAFVYRSSMSQISIEASASRCNVIGERASKCNVVDESAPIKQKRKRKSKQASTAEANQSPTKKSKNGESKKRQTSTNQPVSLFLNPTTADKPAPVAQPVTAGEFVFGNWSAIINQSATNDNQSAAIQSGSSASRPHGGVTKKRKRSQVEGPDNAEDENGKARSPSAGPSWKRGKHKDDKSDYNSEEGQRRRSSMKRKRDEESGNHGNDDKEVKKRK